MSQPAALTLRNELRKRGVALRVVGDRLRYRPVEAVTLEIRERMARLKPELIALLLDADPEEAPIPEYGDGDRPTVGRCPKCGQVDFMRPRPRGRWSCARCDPFQGLAAPDTQWWPSINGPLVPLDQILGERFEKNAASPARPCRCCGGLVLWRLQSGGDWICHRCHPPQPPPEAIEVATVDGGEVRP